VNGQVALALRHTREATPIRKRKFSLASEAAEYRNDVLRRFVRFVNNEHASVGYCPQQRRVHVSDHAALERGLEHELLHCRVAVELNVFAWPLQKLWRRRWD
jgi:hypothetical protein